MQANTEEYSILSHIDVNCLNNTQLPTFFFSELAEIFFVDTTPFVNMYFSKAEGHTYNWRGIISRKAYRANILKV